MRQSDKYWYQQGVASFLEDLPLGLKEERYTVDGLPSMFLQRRAI